MRELICTIILLLVLSCTSGKQAEQSRKTAAVTGETETTQPLSAAAPEAFALEILPKTASRDTTASLTLTGFALQDAKIEWLLNGAPVESSLPNQLKLSEAKKGDTLQARARIRGREILSNKIDITNAPPELTAFKLLTEAMKPGDALGVAVEGRDADGDKVTFLYEWTINGQPAGNQEKIEGAVKRGDSVAVRVTPYDGESYGNAIVQDRTIQNLPPVIQEHGEFKFDGTVYTYQVKASDPDGDTLAYSLEAPPKGMTIDPATGLLTWVVPAEFKGKQDIMIIVSDGHGGTAKYNIKAAIQ